MKNLEIDYIAIEDLIPYARNARTHNDEQVAQIAGSIKEFGFTNPVLLNPDKTIIAGHGRVMAARKLGLEKVPTITLHDLTDAQRRAYVLADNKLALNAGWDEEMLKNELQDLELYLQHLAGFNEMELNLLFNGWDSDIEKMEAIEPKDSVAQERITITCNPELKQELWEAITNLVDSLGLDDVEVS